MKLGELKPTEGSKKNRKRVGCGPGSGHGKTSCRGHKGQNSRSGGGVPARFEGGQMPMQRRLPKRGFHNRFRVEKQVVNLHDLERVSATEINVETLLDGNIIRNLNKPVKLLGEGTVTKALKITVHACSKSAREAVEKAGGEVIIIS